MEKKRKNKKTRHVISHLSDLHISSEPVTVARIVRLYRRTGGFCRRDLRRVLGDQTRGISAGKKGLEELISGTRASR